MSSILLLISISFAFDPTPSSIVEGREAPTYGNKVSFAGDLNGDGYDEVLLSLYGGVELYHGTPTGPATAPERVWLGPVDAYPGHDMGSIGDVNGDGYGDMAIAYNTFGHLGASPWVEIRLGSPTGVSELPDQVITGLDGSDLGQALTYGDCNGDGIDDLFLGDPETGEVQVLPGGVGGLASTPATTYSYPRLGASMAVGDVDGDGLLDLFAATDEAEAPRLYLGDGACGSTGQSVISDAPHTQRVWVSLVDFDNDGRDAMVLAHGRVTVFDGTFPSYADVQGTYTSSPYSIWGTEDVAEPGDVNGDGYDDLVIAGLYNRVVLYGTNGLPTLGSGASSWVSGTDPLRYQHASVGDANGDGTADLLESSLFTGLFDVSYTEGPIVEDFTPTRVFDSAVAPSRLGNALAHGDVNGDGTMDIAAGCDVDEPFWGGTCVFLGGPAGVADQPLLKTAHIGPTTMGDVDQDGVDDLLIIHANPDELHVHLGSVSGPSPTPDRVIPLVLRPTDVDFQHDFDGDGLIDLAMRSNHEVVVGLGKPGGLRAPKSVFSMSKDNLASPRILGYADVNGDGHDDILAQGKRSEDIAWVPFSPTGAAVAAPIPLGLTLAEAPEHMVSGDFDGDGFDDVAFGSSACDGPARCDVMFGSASGLDTTTAVALGRAVLWAGDLDGDGFDDVVTGDAASDVGQGEVAVHMGSAAGIQATPGQVLYGTDDEGLGDAATGADVDADGQLELVVGASRWRAYAGRLVTFEP